MRASLARLRSMGGLLGLALLACLLGAPAASAAPIDDFRAVVTDYAPDRDVTACRFTRQQLQNARDSTPADVQTYVPSFIAEIDAEIRRHDTGGCRSTVVPDGSGEPGPQRVLRLRIARIRPRGGRRESVTIANTGNRRGALRGYSLRNRAGRRVRLPRVTLRPGRALRVITGCARNRRRPARRGGRFFACARGLRWNDRGDVVKLVSPRGRVVAQRGYGSRRGARRI